jgi:hypothetical protein
VQTLSLSNSCCASLRTDMADHCCARQKPPLRHCPAAFSLIRELRKTRRSQLTCFQERAKRDNERLICTTARGTDSSTRSLYPGERKLLMRYGLRILILPEVLRGPRCSGLHVDVHDHQHIQLQSTDTRSRPSRMVNARPSKPVASYHDHPRAPMPPQLGL